MSFYDFSPDRSLETWIDEWRDDMMTSSIIPLIYDSPKIISKIHVECFSDIEIVFRMFRIIRIEWFEYIDQILL